MGSEEKSGLVTISFWGKVTTLGFLREVELATRLHEVKPQYSLHCETIPQSIKGNSNL